MERALTTQSGTLRRVQEALCATGSPGVPSRILRGLRGGSSKLPSHRIALKHENDICAATSPAAAVEAKRPMSPALAVLLTGHVLRDGEVVQLILKPSLWFIPLTSLIFAAAVAMCGMAAALWLPQHIAWYYVQAAIFLIAGRLMWATIQWVNRLYILTDQRVVRLSGAFNVEIFDCPLRRISQTRVIVNFRERILRLGSIEILPADDSKSPGMWQTISRPRQVEEMIREAMRKAQSGCGGL
jgi:hypothetical protein